MNRSHLFSAIVLFEIFFQYVSSQTYTCSPNAPCGCSAQSATLTRIVGGESAASQTWGWAASLRYSSTGSHFCGGSIISALHILTAAHCVTGLSSPSAVTVYVGSIYLSITAQVRSVALIHIHPSYNPNTYVNDLSILKLSTPIDLTQAGVNIVCLPNVSSTVLANEEYPPVNTSLVAIGWGYLYENSGTVSNTLQQVTIQAIADNSIYCQRLSLANTLDQFCAGVMPQGGKDTCQGDSGGPLLMFNSNNVWEQVGITSYGIGCAEQYNPGVYTRVAAYQSWINATMNKANHFYSIAYSIFIPIILFNLF